MVRLLVACVVCLVLVTWEVKGQTCPASLTPKGYFNGVATMNPTEHDLNKYFVIGGLFDIHTKGDDAYNCGTAMSQAGIINLLAFFWAIDGYSKGNIDGNVMIDPAVSVGAIAFDNCMRPEQTIENVLGYAQCKLRIQGMDHQNLVAYVGPYGNEDIKVVAPLAKDLRITLVSPGADAVDLQSDHGTLLRVAPSFKNDLNAIVAFLQQMQSEFVVVLYSASDPFWKSASVEFMQKLRDNEICATLSANIDDHMDDLEEFVAGSLERVTNQRYLVPLMSKESVEKLLKAVSNNVFVDGRFRFILNSRIGHDLALLTSNGNAAKDAILLKRNVPSVYSNALEDFKTYINNGTGDIENVNNPWLAEYKSMGGTLPKLDDMTTPSLLAMAARTLMSVKIIIKGLSTVLEDCNNHQFCVKYRNQNKNLIYSKIRDAETLFDGDTGVLLNSLVDYSYFHFENTLFSDAMLASIGSYKTNTNGKLVATVSDWLKTTFTDAFAVPICNGIKRCCLSPTTTSTPTTVTTASTMAPVGTPSPYSDVRYRSGQAIIGAFPVESTTDTREQWGTRFDLGHNWIIALGALAGLGILSVVVFEIYILYKLLGTRLGRNWRTMWLGQLLLFGVFLAYLVLFTYIFVPTKATCGITRFGVGVSYAICFAVLLVKLMVILTSKTSDVFLPGDESPNYLKGIYQFLMFIFAVGVQIVIDVQWLITVPPEAVQVLAKNGQHVWVCNHYTWVTGSGMSDVSTFVRTNFENHVMSLIYIMVMILITTILSLNAHGIITNHRESVFIGIAAGFSIPIWLAWTLMGGLNLDHDYAHEFGDACIAFGLFLTVTLILFSMFLPKVRQLVNIGVEGIYLEDDRDTFYGGSVIMAPPSYKSKGPSSVIYVNNQGIYSEPVVIGNGDPMATHLKHPGSTYSAPPTFLKKAESAYGSTRVLRVTDDLKGRHPQKRPQSEVAYGTGRPRSMKGTLPRSRSVTNLGAL